MNLTLFRRKLLNVVEESICCRIGEVDMKLKLIILACAALIFLTACSVINPGKLPCGTGGQARLRKSDTYGATSDMQEFHFTVKEDYVDLSLRVYLERDQGGVGWRVLDPNGTELWLSVFTDGNIFRETRYFEVVPGEWTLQLVQDATAGMYDICWTATK